ncbi:MAG: Lon protease family protein, partial [Myxococcota bacterium]
MDLHSDRTVSAERLRGHVDPDSLGSFQTTTELLDGPDPMAAGLSFQPRVRQALSLALNVRERGFNVFATGDTGLRKSQSIIAVLEAEARGRPPPGDWCYVFNFKDPDRPRALSLPAGEGREFARSMERFIESLRGEIPRALESEDYRKRRQSLSDELHRRRQDLLNEIRDEGKQRGFTVEMGPAGLMVAPLDQEGSPLTPQAYEELPEEDRQRFEEQSRELRNVIEQRMRSLQASERQGRERVETLDRETVFLAAGEALEELRSRYHDNPNVLDHLTNVQEDIATRLGELRAADEASEMPPLLAALQGRSAPFERYRANVIVDRAEDKGAPVVFEAFPTYVNLAGRLERKVEFGNLVTDFTLLRAGALHRANGGFLEMFADDLLRQPGAWDGVKRSLKAGEIIIEDLPSMMGLSVAQALKPEPIPLDVRVVLIGSPVLYHLLYVLDPDFRRLFQVRADFDHTMAAEGNVEAFARSVARLANDEGIAPLDRSGVARVAGFAMRVAENQRKFTTRFSSLAQLLHEANRIRHEAGDLVIGARHVKEAEDARRFRNSLPQEHLREMISRGVLMVSTSGEAVGRVNGLALSTIGDTTLGRPVRISAAVSPGGGEVADIERRSELGGRLHTKAVMILSGYLASRYAAEIPLSISGQITFEQSYAEIEGDSASLAETIALLSAIGRLPLSQGIALTGSVSHMGDVQPVGGISDKIEGYFDVCRAVGLTGKQGVVIPKANLEHVQLRDEVIEEVEAGRFHLWAVSHVDEAIEILSGIPAGQADIG